MKKLVPKIILVGLFASGMALAFGPKEKKELAWVFSPDGSKQCGFETGSEIREGEQLLAKAGIRVEKTHKGSDGAMRMQMCGAPTGTVNAYLIEESRIPEAEKLGFRRAPEGFPFQ